ncbi:MAG: TIGR04283 family arsenosugar biosynthesis glycosyltransferase [Hyphomicrobiaceae bacterium]|nr:TIGR04283 family arsenosugar biosynthesis glycosyltransferase [Hyphomicrobiaceae bacterium]
MISVVIPTLNAGCVLAPALSALIPAMVDGLVREVIVADAGSTDCTLEIAEAAGTEIVRSEPGRGSQLIAGAQRARFPWLLFLHADSVLEPGWHGEASAFIARVETGQRPPAAAAFRFALDDVGFRPRLIEAGVSLRCALLRLPYGDQGLLVPARLYREIGGYRPMPLMEDVDMVRRLGRRRLTMLRSRAVTSASRYRRDGYGARVVRNLCCLALYFMRLPVQTIARLYG